MSVRSVLVTKIAQEIVNQQYPDNAKFGINNHFLVDVINDVVALQADKIKECADFIFEDAKINKVKEYDDLHSLRCKVLVNSDEKSVLTIEDESGYGPNMNFILVIDDKLNGRFHIKRLNSKKELAAYKNKKFNLERLSFTDGDFVFFYEYMSSFFRNIIERCKTEEDKQELIKAASGLKKIEEMGDNTFVGYERVEYATSLLFGIKREIKEGKNERSRTYNK